MQKPRPAWGLSFAMAAWTLVAPLAGAVDSPTQGLPDIFWITNGPNAHFAAVRSVSLSADSALLASGSEDGHAKVWAVDTKALVTDVGVGEPWMLSVALYPPEDLLLTGSDDGGVRGWSIATGRRLFGAGRELDGETRDIVWAVAISIDGITAIGRSYISLQSPPGRFILDDDCDDELWCLIFSLAFSADGSKLASSGAAGTAKIWSVSDGSLLHLLTGHSYFNPTNEEDVIIHTVWSVDFSPDGALLATSGADNTIRLWRVSDGTQVGVIESPGVGLAKFSADGALLLTLNGGAIHFYRVVDGQLLATYPNARATCLDVASNGRYFAYGTLDGSVAVAYLPVVIQSMTQAGGKITLQWQGGSGLYRVQACSDLDKGKWHSMGPPTANTTFTHSAKSHLFYRVQSLPNP